MQSGHSVTPRALAWMETNSRAMTAIDGHARPLPPTRIRFEISYRMSATGPVRTLTRIVTQTGDFPGRKQRTSDDDYIGVIHLTDRTLLTYRKTPEVFLWGFAMNLSEPPVEFVTPGSPPEHWTITTGGTGANVPPVNPPDTRIAPHMPVMIGLVSRVPHVLFSSTLDIEVCIPLPNFPPPRNVIHPVVGILMRWERHIFSATTAPMTIPPDDLRFSLKVTGHYNPGEVGAEGYVEGRVVACGSEREVTVLSSAVTANDENKRGFLLRLDPPGMLRCTRTNDGAMTWAFLTCPSLWTVNSSMYFSIGGDENGPRRELSFLQRRWWWNARLWELKGAPGERSIPLTEVAVAANPFVERSRTRDCEARFIVWLRRLRDIVWATPFVVPMPATHLNRSLRIRYSIPGDARGERDARYDLEYLGHGPASPVDAKKYQWVEVSFLDRVSTQRVLLFLLATPKEDTLVWRLVTPDSDDVPGFSVRGTGGLFLPPTPEFPLNPGANVEGVRHSPGTFRLDVTNDFREEGFVLDALPKWQRAEREHALLPTTPYAVTFPGHPALAPLPPFNNQPARRFAALYAAATAMEEIPGRFPAEMTTFTLEWAWSMTPTSQLRFVSRSVKFVIARHVTIERLRVVAGERTGNDVGHFGIEFIDVSNKTRLTVWRRPSGAFEWRLVSYLQGSNGVWEGFNTPIFIAKGTNDLAIDPATIKIDESVESNDWLLRHIARVAHPSDDVYARRNSWKTPHSAGLRVTAGEAPWDTTRHVLASSFRFGVELFAHAMNRTVPVPPSHATVFITLRYARTADAKMSLEPGRRHRFTFERVEIVDAHVVRLRYSPSLSMTISKRETPGGVETDGTIAHYRWTLDAVNCPPNEVGERPFSFSAIIDTHARAVTSLRISESPREMGEEEEEGATFDAEKFKLVITGPRVVFDIPSASDLAARRAQAARRATFEASQAAVRQRMAEEAERAEEADDPPVAAMEGITGTGRADEEEIDDCLICTEPNDPRDASNPFFTFHPHGRKHYFHVDCILTTMTARSPLASNLTMEDDEEAGEGLEENGPFFDVPCPVCRETLRLPTNCPTFVRDVVHRLNVRRDARLRDSLMRMAARMFDTERRESENDVDPVILCVLFETYRPVIALNQFESMQALQSIIQMKWTSRVAKRWSVYFAARLLSDARTAYADSTVPTGWRAPGNFNGILMTFTVLLRHLSYASASAGMTPPHPNDDDGVLRVALERVKVPTHVTMPDLHPSIPDGMWGSYEFLGQHLIHFADTTAVTVSDDAATAVSSCINAMTEILKSPLDASTPRQKCEAPGISALMTGFECLSRWILMRRRETNPSLYRRTLVAVVEQSMWENLAHLTQWNDRTSLAFRTLWRAKNATTEAQEQAGLTRFKTGLLDLAVNATHIGAEFALTALRSMTWDDDADFSQLDRYLKAPHALSSVWERVKARVPSLAEMARIARPELETPAGIVPFVPIVRAELLLPPDVIKFQRFRIWTTEFVKRLEASHVMPDDGRVTLEFGYDYPSLHFNTHVLRNEYGDRLEFDRFVSIRVRPQIFRVTRVNNRPNGDVTRRRMFLHSVTQVNGEWTTDPDPTVVVIDVKRGRLEQNDSDDDQADEFDDDVANEFDARGAYNVRWGVRIRVRRYPSAREIGEWRNSNAKVRESRRDGVGKILGFDTKARDDADEFSINGSVEREFIHPDDAENEEERAGLQSYLSAVEGTAGVTGFDYDYPVSSWFRQMTIRGMHKEFVGVVSDSECFSVAHPRRRVNTGGVE